MLYKLEFPMYFYCGILNVGEGIEYFLGKKSNLCCNGHKEASDLAGRPGFVKSKTTFRSLAKGTGQRYPARPLGQELGETASAYLAELSLHFPR